MTEQPTVPQEVWEPTARAVSDDERDEYLLALLRRVTADPGQWTKRDRHWGPERDESEPLHVWQARAVRTALLTDERTYVGVKPGPIDPGRYSEHVLHQMRAHPDFEYVSTQSPRKGDSTTPGGEGWEPNPIIPVHEYSEGTPVRVIAWRNWEREDYFDEEHWRRRRLPATEQR